MIDENIEKIGVAYEKDLGRVSTKVARLKDYRLVI